MYPNHAPIVKVPTSDIAPSSRSPYRSNSLVSALRVASFKSCSHLVQAPAAAAPQPEQTVATFTQDPFAMFDSFFGAPAPSYGNPGAASLTSVRNDPFAMFDAIFDTSGAAHDFIETHTSNNTAPPTRSQTDPYPAFRQQSASSQQQQPAQQMSQRARGSMMDMGAGGGDPFSSMFNALSVGMGGFDDLMNNNNNGDPNRRGKPCPALWVISMLT